MAALAPTVGARCLLLSHSHSLPVCLSVSSLFLFLCVVSSLSLSQVSATFNVAVSAVTLGYWDIWCERVYGGLS